MTLYQDAALEDAFAALRIERDTLQRERDEARRACVMLRIQYEGSAAHEILVVAAHMWNGREEALRLFRDDDLRAVIKSYNDEEEYDFEGEDHDLLELIVRQNHQELDEQFLQEPTT